MRIRIASSLAAAGLVVAGCGSTPSPASGKASGHAPITLSVFDSRGSLFATFFQKKVNPGFLKAHPGVHISWTETGGSPTTYLSAAAAGHLGCVLGENTQLAGDLIKYNLFSPVDQHIITNLSQYLPIFKKEFTNSKGQLLLVPYLGGGDMWYFRTNGGPQGAPQNLTTYSQWITWAKSVTKYGPSGKVIYPGIGWRYGHIPQFPTQEFMELVTAAGGKFLNKGSQFYSTKAEFDSAAGVTALKFWWDTIWKYHVAWAPDQTPSNAADPVANFVQGKEASTYLGPWLPLMLATLGGNTPGLSHVKKTWDAVYLMPHPDGQGHAVAMASVDGWGVPSSCAHKTLAWEYIRYLTSKSVLTQMYAAVNHPLARKTVMLSSAARSTRRKDMPGAVHESAFWTNRSIVSTTINEPDVAANPSIFLTMNKYLESVLNNPRATVATMKAALGSAATQVDHELAQSGY